MAGSSARIGFSVPIALFLSGGAGLMHEVVWAKLLATFVGNTAHAQAIVLTVFMAGLALGSVLLGRFVDRSQRPLAIYFVLEVVTAAYCLLLPFILWGAAGIYETLAALVFESTWLTFALRFTLALLVVLPPAALMGGTLPVLARFAVATLADTRARVGLLYGLNNLGAATGAAVAGFVTLAALGIYPSLAIASGLNVVAGVLALVAERRLPAARGVASPKTKGRATPDEPVADPGASSLRAGAVTGALFALFASGFAAMGLEVVFLRVIALAFGSSTYSFTAMLVSFIAGIGIGSYIASRLTVRRPLLWFGLSQLAATVALLAVTPLLARLPYLLLLLRVRLGDSAAGFELYLLGQVGLCLLFLLIPTACIGFGFPLVTQIQTRELRRVGSEVGRTYAWNTTGNVLGVLVTSLVLMPTIGTLPSLHLNLALQVAAGACALALSGARVMVRLVPLGAVAAAALVYLGAGTGWSDNLTLAKYHFRWRTGPRADADEAAKERHPATSFAAWQRQFVMRREDWPVLQIAEDAHATVVAAGSDDALYLYVNGKTDASTDQDLQSQILVAQVPMMLAREQKSLLVIGHGSGITAGSAAVHPVERVDLVEISRAVLDVDPVFAHLNHRVLADPRVHVYVDDARSFLRTSPRTYDVIISEPTNPWIAGVSNLFTVEFFREAAAKLNPGGVFCFWFHEYDQNEDTVSLVLRSLHSVFPHATMFRAHGYADVVALASTAPIQIDFDRLEERFDRPAVREEMARIQILSLASFLIHHAISAERFEALLGAGPLNTDLRQRLEYEAPRAFFRAENSRLISQHDALERSGMGQTDSLLDRYLEQRARSGQPVSRAELDAALLHLERIGMNKGVARAVSLRGAMAPSAGPGTRPARGGVPAMAELGPNESYARAISAFFAGNYAEAIELYRRCLVLRPGNGLAKLSLSVALTRAGKMDEAIALLQEAIGDHPFDHRMKFELAQLLEKKGDFAGATQLYQRGSDSDHPDSLSRLADLVAAQGRPDDAMALYAKALVVDDAHASAALGLARILGRYPATRERALKVLADALVHSPGHEELAKLQYEISLLR